jgi:hypothetical protein
MKRLAVIVLWSTILFVARSSAETSPIQVLLLDGQSAWPYHNWQLTTRVLKRNWKTQAGFGSRRDLSPV